MELNVDHIKKAYLFLKSYAYHDNLNLFLRQRVAAFETTNSKLEQEFQKISSVINNDSPCEELNFRAWLKDIDYHILPKAVERTEDRKQNHENNINGLFISNVRDSDQYLISKVNYFINAPVEIHILEMLWCLFVGPALEQNMSKDSYGNRMHPSAIKFSSDEDLSGQEIFKRYIDQYNQWRDQAINTATKASTKREGEDVALLSLDLKAYFYHIDLNFEHIQETVTSHYSDNLALRNLAEKLTHLLDKVYTRYQQVIAQQIKLTHINCKDKNCLPIGMASSSIIANWYLSDFDACISDDVRPIYYGRYVDDIIMVFQRPKFDKDNPIPSFVQNYLSKVLTPIDDKRREYAIDVNGNKLPMQKDKLILQFFDQAHSRAGLEVFKQELDERSSAFKFLPSDHIDKDLDQFAYDILYDGSANKLRSIVGLAENETELAKYLSSHITAHRLCELNKKDRILAQLEQFFKGQNALQFFRLWEKLYQYSVITRNYGFASFFYQYLEEEIAKIVGVKSDSKRWLPTASQKLRKDLLLYNDLSCSLTLGLLDITNPTDLPLGAFSSKKESLENICGLTSDRHEFAWQMRKSNLIRHHLVAWPLSNFTDFPGDLTKESDFMQFEKGDIEVDDSKLQFSPRYIHLDEWQIFRLGESLDCDKSLNKWLSDSLSEYQKLFRHDLPIKLTSSEKDNAGITKSDLLIKTSELKSNLTLAIANLQVDEQDIENATRRDRAPNLSFERQEKLYSILNAALYEKSDLLVMPEVSIPVSWLPFMISFSRRHQIGLIFGLEHWLYADTAYNLIIEALPFKTSGKYKSCVMTARVKNHYAPAELELLDSLRLDSGNLGFKPDSFYHKVSWRGVSFATYNCFELSDITHRVIFKSEIDLLFACVWNKDTNYYQHILESAVRDLHCYTVQANTSQYGGSCVLRPTNTDNKTMLYVKGGENPCVLTTKLDIEKLRAFQFKSKPGPTDSFKHLPPGYDCTAVKNR